VKGSVNVAELREATMLEELDKRVSELPTLNKEVLCNLWKQEFGSPPPAKLRRDLMIPILAFGIQERVFGSLNARTRSCLRQLARDFESNPNSKGLSRPRFKPGTRLVREWRDQVHLVNVGTKDYEYRGTRYRSLSEIARLITGTRWSGPLFFGTKGDQASTSKEAQ
jgi:hypothetical protein